MLENKLDSLLHDARNHHKAGRFDEAEELYQKILEFKPNNAEVQSKLGAALAAQGKLIQSLSILNRAMENNPNLAEIHINLGGVLQIQGEMEAAALAFQRAIKINPNQASSHINLGNTLLKKGDLDDATASFNRALKIEPDSPHVFNGLATASMKKNNFNEAAENFSRALALSPDQPETLCNLGILLRSQGKNIESEKAFRKAIALQPKSVEFHINLGNTLKSRCNLIDAMESYQHALSLEPNNADAHLNKAKILLLLGRIEEGWLEFEWRKKCYDFQPLLWQPGGPTWDGSNLDGKTILIYCEQNYGDSIQFIRYAQLLAEMGARVIVKCQPKLQPLFKTIYGVDRAITSTDKSSPYHFQASLLSLPLLFRTNSETIPAQVPYISFPNQASRDLISDGDRKVGIVWAGSSIHKNDQQRSMSLKHFEPLLDMEEFTFYSLQFGERSQDIKILGLDHTLRNLEQDLDGFMATAAMLEKLDLIISVDTSTAHLAGALGKPIWTLLSFVPDWRWMLGRDDSLWYPTMRLFRQSAPGDWHGVMEDVKNALFQSLLN